MLFRVLADAVVVLHLAFILFAALGALLAWRWPRLVWLHVPALAWSVAIIAIGFECPLTPVEKGLIELGGEEAYTGGFVDRYIEDVVYPDEYTPHLRLLAGVLIVVGYWGLIARRRNHRQPSGRSDPVTTTSSP